MGAPNINSSLSDNQEAIDAVNAACDSTFYTLANNTQKGEDYISNSHFKK
jgi:hypothetical protein